MSVKGVRTRNQKPAKPSSQGATVVPETYPPDVLDIICQRVLSGERLMAICKQDRMPKEATVMRWLNEDENFRNRFLDCQRIRALLDTELMQSIADGDTKVSIEKVVVNNDGKEETVSVEVPEDVQRSALRVKTIQWRAAKLLPKVFGDKIQQEHTLTGDLAELLKSASNAGHKLPEAN